MKMNLSLVAIALLDDDWPKAKKQSSQSSNRDLTIYLEILSSKLSRRSPPRHQILTLMQILTVRCRYMSTVKESLVLLLLVLIFATVIFQEQSHLDFPCLVMSQ